jgi:AcrR family transcriptional regulator
MFSHNTSIRSHKSAPGPVRRRQARGERRIAQLLDAAAEVFAEAGYGAATTNAIAARAGVSPGSLYQFFDNKDAIAEALALRYVDQLAALRADAVPGESRPSLDRVLDLMVDPLVDFNLANPAFQALLHGPDAPTGLTRATERLYRDALSHVDALLGALAPGLSAEERRRRAVVCKHVAKALLPLILAAEASERERLVAELKSVLRGYLAPLAES